MMPADKTPSCPECESGPVAEPIWPAATSSASSARRRGGRRRRADARCRRPAPPAPRSRREAEALVFELYKSMDGDQKKKLVLPWDHKAGKQPLPARLMTANAAVGKESVIGLGVRQEAGRDPRPASSSRSATARQGYKQLSRNGKFDNSGDFENIGALIYGEPAEGKKFSLVFCGHHLTVRCDGNSEEATAFGGPLYYGHSPSGYATTNVFYDQTKVVDRAVRDRSRRAATKVAVMPGKWKDEHGTIKPPEEGRDSVPGLCFADMTKDQKELVEKVMKELVSPVPQGRRRRGDGDRQGERRDGEDQRSRSTRKGRTPRGAVDLLAAGRPRLRLELPRPAAHPHVREHQLAS